MRSMRGWVCLATLLMVIASSEAAVSNAEEMRPNVVVFLVDDMGLMDTSVPFLVDEVGQPTRHPLNEFYRTPSMKRLADRGIRFSNFYAMSVCSPTRASLVTGQNSARHHITNWINPSTNNRGPLGPRDWRWSGLDRGSTTLPRLLQQAGYRTIHVGKGHFGPDGSEGEDPRNLGFDVNVGGRAIGQPASYYGQQNYGNGKKRASHAVPHLERYHGTDTFLTDALTLEAKRHVSEAVAESRPFFLYLAHYAVHAPFNSDPRFAQNYRDSGKPPPAQAFATLIEGMDKSLGDLLDHLESLGVARDTLVLFLGDNGSDAPLGGPHEVASSAPLRGRKGSHYEGGMRVPFIASWAAPAGDHPLQRRLPIAAGGVQTQLAAVYDLFPTVLKVAGISIPESHTIDGSDLTHLLTGAPDGSRESVFLMHYPHAPHRSDYFTVYRQGPWKLAYHYHPRDGSPRAELFHLRDDPFESSSVAEKYPAEVKRLFAAMVERLEQQQAQFPVNADGSSARPMLP